MKNELIIFYNEFRHDVVSPSVKHIIHCLNYRNEQKLKEYFINLSQEEKFEILEYFEPNHHK